MPSSSSIRPSYVQSSFVNINVLMAANIGSVLGRDPEFCVNLVRSVNLLGYERGVTVRHSECPPLRRSCPPFRLADANRLVKLFPRIPGVRVRVRVRLDQPAIQVSSRSFGMADLRSGGPKSSGEGLSNVVLTKYFSHTPSSCIKRCFYLASGYCTFLKIKNQSRSIC